MSASCVPFTFKSSTSSPSYTQVPFLTGAIALLRTRSLGGLVTVLLSIYVVQLFLLVRVQNYSIMLRSERCGGCAICCGSLVAEISLRLDLIVML